MTEHTVITGRAKTVDPRRPAAAVGWKRISNRCTVLLLEDEPLISMDIETTLGGAEFDVVTVMSGLEAHNWLALHHPDAVIVDVDLRDGRCTEVASRLVRMHIPFIVHSGQQERAFADTPFASGTWIGKRSVPAELLYAVKTAVGLLCTPPRHIMTG